MTLPEEENFLRIVYLHYRVVTPSLKRFFDGKHPNLSADLATNKTILYKLHKPPTKNNKKPILYAQQWNTLYPPTGSPPVVSNVLDLTLMVCLLRNIPPVVRAPKPGGFDKLPLEIDISDGANIARIKHYKNLLVSHSTDGKLDIKDYSDIWTDLETAIKGLGNAQDVADANLAKSIILDGSMKNLLSTQLALEAKVLHLQDQMETIQYDKNIIQTRIQSIEEQIITNELKTSQQMEENKNNISRSLQEMQDKNHGELTQINITIANLEECLTTLNNFQVDISDKLDKLDISVSQNKTVIDDLKCQVESTCIEINSYIWKLNKRIDLVEKKTTKQVNELREEIEYLKANRKKVPESPQIEIEEWEEQNKSFIKTDAVDSVLYSLKYKNCCTVIGTSGIGKSATIHHVALFLRDNEGYRIIPIHSPSDIEKNFNRHQKQIFVIDDICGKYTVIQTEVEKWIKQNDLINRVLKDNIAKVIASCRIQVFDENQFKRLELFTKNVSDLSSDTFHLSYQVKLQIARQYLPERAVEYIKNDLDQKKFLPLMFALYKLFSKENENIDVVKFFKNPFNIYTEEIDALHLLLDKTKFCALFFLVICNGILNVSLLTSFESEKERQKREDFFEDCGIPRNTLRQRILEQLESLVPLFVKSNYNLSRQVISFSAMHDKTFDVLCFYFGHKFEKSFLRFADSKLLFERTMLKSLISPDETVEDFTILISESNEDVYFKRIIDQWSMGDLVSLFYSRQMSLEKCRYKLVDYLKRLPGDRRRELITLSIEKKESFVEFNYWSDGCSGSLPLSPLSLAFKRNFSELIRYILNFIKDTKGDRFSILFIKACFAGLTDVVKKFIDNGSDIHVTDMDGRTPLIASSSRQNIEIVRLLIEKGANVNVFDKDGKNPLLWSCFNNNSGIVQLLLEKGADVNISDGDGYTPLIWSCERNNSEIIRLLIRNGAEVNVSSMNGKNPLKLSCKKNNSDIIRLLLEKGADVNAFDISGQTPLILQCYNDNNEIVRLLIEHGAEVNVSDFMGYTPLILSCEHDSSEISRLLLEKGADFNASDANGRTPLIMSCKKNNSEIVRLLLEKGADINAFDINGQTPLILSYANDNSEIVRLLIEKGAAEIDKNHKCRYQSCITTPVSGACQNMEGNKIVHFFLNFFLDSFFSV